MQESRLQKSQKDRCWLRGNPQSLQVESARCWGGSTFTEAPGPSNVIAHCLWLKESLAACCHPTVHMAWQ
jgi:hypothetical protein